jgi:hypothetical protein
MKKVFFLAITLIFFVSCQKFHSKEEVENYYEESYDYYDSVEHDLFKTYNKAIKKFQTVRKYTAPGKKYADEYLYGKATTFQLFAIYKKDKYSDDLEKVAKEWVEAYPSKESYKELASQYYSKDEKLSVLENACNKGFNLHGEIGDLFKYDNPAKALGYYNKAVELGNYHYCPEVAEMYITQEQYYTARDFLYKHIHRAKDNLWTIANTLEKLADKKIENNKEFGLDIINRLIREYPDRINYREKKIRILLNLERFYDAESYITLTSNEFSSFKKEEYMKSLIRAEFELYSITCRIKNNKEDSFFGNFFFDEKIELENHSRFYIKNISLEINSIYKNNVSSLSPHSSVDFKTNLFANSRGEKLDRDKYKFRTPDLTHIRLSRF